MKKLIAILLTVLVICTLCACNNNNDVTPTNTNSGAANSSSTPYSEIIESFSPEVVEPDEIFDLAAIFAGEGTKEVLSMLPDIEKQMIVDEADAGGCTLVFNANGTTTVTENVTGIAMTQDINGNWTQTSEEKSTDTGSVWPNNEFTKMLPKPEFELAGVKMLENSFVATFLNAHPEAIREYALEAKAAGFTREMVENDREVGGSTIYSLSAENSRGYKINIVFSGNTCQLSLTAPQQ